MLPFCIEADEEREREGEGEGEAAGASTPDAFQACLRGFRGWHGCQATGERWPKEIEEEVTFATSATVYSKARERE